MDHIESRCCFDLSACTGTPDTAPCPKAVHMPEFVSRLDALYAKGLEYDAGTLLEQTIDLTHKTGDWKSELSLLSELCGHCRRSAQKDRALSAIERIYEIIKEHSLGRTVSAATVLLNAATTLKCFSMADRSLPVFEHVCRVYGDNLDPYDYRFAGLYNNMALSCSDVGDYEQAEALFNSAMKVIQRCNNPQNEMAVTLCNLAELYYKQNAEDERVNLCMEKAWEQLNDPRLPQDGYHAFTVSKCAPSFDYFGYFLYSKELKERAARIYALS